MDIGRPSNLPRQHFEPNLPRPIDQLQHRPIATVPEPLALSENTGVAALSVGVPVPEGGVEDGEGDLVVVEPFLRGAVRSDRALFGGGDDLNRKKWNERRDK